MYVGPIGWFEGGSEFAVSIRPALVTKELGASTYVRIGIVEGLCRNWESGEHMHDKFKVLACLHKSLKFLLSSTSSVDVSIFLQVSYFF
ncbi:putative isochorismate synthase [Helianthus debilis subsp. tardiflorus]